ncbi:MAG: hypothetical protein M3495_14425 [Pseudomonadota bacterium]|nr:hypothetical protein [Pseudomonadota bacterium]
MTNNLRLSAIGCFEEGSESGSGGRLNPSGVLSGMYSGLDRARALGRSIDSAPPIAQVGDV